VLAVPSFSIPNKLLSRLSADDLELLSPHLKRVALPLRKRLETPRKAIEHIYFPESGFVSVVADGLANQRAEVGIIGREGMTGLAVVLRVHSAGRATGLAWRCPFRCSGRCWRRMTADGRPTAGLAKPSCIIDRMKESIARLRA
jgi:hypothetical protein